MVPANNESSLLLAVANQPIVVSIEADNLMFYEGGVYSGDCGTNLDHVVTATGYGTTENDTHDERFMVHGYSVKDFSTDYEEELAWLYYTMAVSFNFYINVAWLMAS
ncbi:hypothetical protein RJ640_015962 [Escallonia rubra]|uniref:Peptidase C1A papain C-terminal domain-containing protein n=1 Tax=Escallonia rubra TaxID=112253 RepID=A0AA88S5W9_9ASTE|nr:hypothetical protein RJ640_015962 [Escallonia rubra]